MRINDDSHQVLGVELPEFDEDATAILAVRRVTATGRIPDVMAGRIIAMIIREHTTEHQKFLTLGMLVPGEGTTRRVTHDAGRSGDLFTDSIEHDPVDT
jgi:hypothetical protein